MDRAGVRGGREGGTKKCQDRNLRKGAEGRAGRKRGAGTRKCEWAKRK